MKKLIYSFILILFIILVFTGIDYLVHSATEEYSVPSYYFRNKVIFGTVIGFIAYLFVKNKKLFTKSLIFSLAISILLQIRYFIEGYPRDFVFIFLFIHFAILLA